MSGKDLFFVIGSNSFSGSSYIRMLLEKGHPVIGVSRSEEPHVALLPHLWANTDKYKFYKLDLNHDLDEIIALIELNRPKYIVNYAAQSMVAESWLNPDHWFMTNAVSTVRLQDQLRKMSFIKRYVHISTPEVYGNTLGEVTEDTQLNPSTPYAVSRAAADMSLRTFYAAYNMPVVFTRAANVYGPGQQLYRIIPRTILYIRTGKTLQLHGGGLSRRSFIHIDDVSEATYSIAINGNNGDVYHISTQDLVSIRSLVEMICDRLGVAFDKHVEIVGERLGKDDSYHLSSEKLRKELGWRDEKSLDQGLTEVMSWVDKYIENLASLPLQYIHKP